MLENLGVILVQIWCNILCDDTHDIHDIARNHTIVGACIARPRATNGRPYGERQFVKTLPSYLLLSKFMV